MYYIVDIILGFSLCIYIESSLRTVLFFIRRVLTPNVGAADLTDVCGSYRAAVADLCVTRDRGSHENLAPGRPRRSRGGNAGVGERPPTQ